MFNVGTGELFVILLIALIVLGPDKLPDAARKVGNVVAELRRMSSGLQDEMRSTLNSPAPPVATRDEPVSGVEPERSEPAA